MARVPYLAGLAEPSRRGPSLRPPRRVSLSRPAEPSFLDATGLARADAPPSNPPADAPPTPGRGGDVELRPRSSRPPEVAMAESAADRPGRARRARRDPLPATWEDGRWAAPVDLAARHDQPSFAAGTSSGPAALSTAEPPKPPVAGPTSVEGVVDIPPDPAPELRPDPAALDRPPWSRPGPLPQGHDVHGAFEDGGRRGRLRGGAPQVSIGTIEVVVTRPAPPSVAAPRPDPPSAPHGVGTVQAGPPDRGRDGRRRWYGTAQS